MTDTHNLNGKENTQLMAQHPRTLDEIAAEIEAIAFDREAKIPDRLRALAMLIELDEQNRSRQTVWQKLDEVLEQLNALI